MAAFWFFAGILFTLAGIVLMWPWLRTIPRLESLPAIPWQAGIGAIVVMSAVFGSYFWFGRPELAVQTRAAAVGNPAGSSAAASNNVAKSLFNAANVLDNGSSTPGNSGNPATNAGAGSMTSAIAALETRLAKGGGSADEWELLAKSYDFLGRPEDANKARARQLPPVPAGEGATAGVSAAVAPPRAQGPASGAAVSGEVSLSAALRSKAAAGATLFIVAKSVDSPGAPLAVFRATVGTWPVKFTLDDSRSMLAGRKLSGAGRVTIEARISQSGQPMPAAGDLQGSSGVINPADGQPLKIVIDRVIT